MSVEIRFDRATLGAANYFAEHLREADRQEVLAMDDDIRASIQTSIRLSLGDTWIVSFNGEPAALYGVVTLGHLTGYAVPWLITTPVVDRFPKTFVRACQKGVIRLRRHYKLLNAHVHARYGKALRLMTILGFEVQAPQSRGPHGARFCLITLEGV